MSTIPQLMAGRKLTHTLDLDDDVAIRFGRGEDASIEYDENGTDQLRITGSTIFASAVEFDGATTFDAAVLLNSTLKIVDDTALTFGSNNDVNLKYDEASSNTLLVSGGHFKHHTDSLHLMGAQTVDMANAAHALVMSGAGANEDNLVSNIVYVDPNGGAQTLTLPAEANFGTGMLVIVNTANAAETVTIADDAAATVATPDQNEMAICVCDGVTWRGLNGAA